MAYSPAKKTNTSNEGNTKGSDDTIKTDETTKSGTYASAKKKDPKLDSYIKTRNNAKKSGDKSAQDAAQNKINKAYGKGPTDRKTGVEMEKIEPRTIKVSKPEQTKEEKVDASKPKSAMDKAKEAIASGDKKAAKKSGLKGKVKRVAKKAAKEVGKKIGKEVALDKAAEANTKKEVRKSGVKGKFKRAAKQDVAAASKQKKKQQITELTSSAAPTTFKSFDQMDSKNAMATAGEGSMSTMYSDGPIKYFKQSIKYNVKEASNPSLSSSARKHYAENAQHDMKSMGKMDKTMAYKHGAMKGDQSASRIDYANYKGTDKGYHGKTGASHGDQSASKADYMGKSKKGSIISKHMKS